LADIWLDLFGEGWRDEATADCRYWHQLDARKMTENDDLRDYLRKV